MSRSLPILTVLFLTACADGRAILEVPFALDPIAPGPYAIDGHEVTVEAASITLDAIRLRAPSGSLARSPLQRLREAVVPSAWAHPGHGAHGGVVGEWLGPETLDLLTAHDLGAIDGFEGEVADASFDLTGVAFAVQGRVGAPGAPGRPFSFVLDEDVHVAHSPAAFVLDPDTQPPSLRGHLDLRGILEDVVWDVPDADGDGTLTLSDAEEVANSVFFGVQHVSHWNLEVR